MSRFNVKTLTILALLLANIQAFGSDGAQPRLERISVDTQAIEQLKQFPDIDPVFVEEVVTAAHLSTVMASTVEDWLTSVESVSDLKSATVKSVKRASNGAAEFDIEFPFPGHQQPSAIHAKVQWLPTGALVVTQTSVH